jgi:hypothetical protein
MKKQNKDTAKWKRKKGHIMKLESPCRSKRKRKKSTDKEKE